MQQFVYEKYEQDKIGRPDVFPEIQFAEEFKNSFFQHFGKAKLFAIYFDENEARKLLDIFKPQNSNDDTIGIYKILSKKIPETNNSTLLGYDLIGIEEYGDFHSFHCHNIIEELSNKFGITLNEYGLFNDYANWDLILDYMNDEKTACEPVPWFTTKVKILNS